MMQILMRLNGDLDQDDGEEVVDDEDEAEDLEKLKMKVMMMLKMILTFKA
jgi:hypothetical protein